LCEQRDSPGGASRKKSGEQDSTSLEKMYALLGCSRRVPAQGDFQTRKQQNSAANMQSGSEREWGLFHSPSGKSEVKTYDNDFGC
jgi:hypothetical protein